MIIELPAPRVGELKMRIAKTTIYNIDELKEKSQETAINKYIEADIDSPFLNQDLNEQLNETLQENKIHTLNKLQLFYSLNNCQGDGAVFVGLFKWKHYTVIIEHSGHYNHENSKTITIETPAGHDAKDSVYNDFNTLFVRICQDIAKQGYDRIEAEQDPENVKETMRANEYEFTSNGNLWTEQEAV